MEDGEMVPVYNSVEWIFLSKVERVAMPKEV